jgi:hypothetical protein
MWRKAMLLSVVAVLAMPILAQAQFHQSDWELTLSGSGSNDKDFDSGAFSIAGSLGYFVSDQLEISGRQGIVWADGGSAWSGDSRIAVDYHFDLGRWVPFVGGNIGYVYGDNTDDSWIAGPEGGVKYFVNDTTFIQANVAYEFDLNDGFDEGAFFYGLGIGFRF